MSFLSVMPEQIESTAQGLAGIRSALAESSAAAATPTTAVVAAAEDEISAAIASLFGDFGQEFQVLNAQAAAFHDGFVNLLQAGAGAYVGAEAANAAAGIAALQSVGAGLIQGGADIVALGQDVAAKFAAALQAAEPGLAKAAGELLTAGQITFAGVQQLQPAVADLIQAGSAFASAGTGAVTGLTALGSAAVDLVQGTGFIALAGGSALSGLGLLGSAVVEFFSPSIALALPDCTGRTWPAGYRRC